MLRPGDFDLDGYPDLLVPIRDRDTKETTVHILHNVPCGKAAGCIKDRKSQYQRGFEVGRGKGWQALEDIKDATGASWIDLDDDVSTSV
jgi:integrin alpha FG-GAP repeat containing protein 1